MKSKSILTGLLILFITASAGYLVMNSYRTIDSTASPKITTNEQKPIIHETGKTLTHNIIAYYFHTTYRCYSCKKIESLSREAIKKGFPDDLKNGRLIWKPVNIDKPENNHFAKIYDLHTKSVIIVEVKNNRQIQWKNLDKVWHLLNNDNGFTQYIQEEVKEYLEKING